MLEILDQNRDLEQQLKETKNMLTQIDVSRLPSYQWGREDARNKFKKLLAETDSVLQEKENLFKQALQKKDQQILGMIELARLTRKRYLSGSIDAATIADLLEMPLAEVVALFQND